VVTKATVNQWHVEVSREIRKQQKLFVFWLTVKQRLHDPPPFPAAEANHSPILFPSRIHAVMPLPSR
jgi:hypothetical protein